MEECGVGCACKSCRRQHRAGTGTKARNPLLKALSQLVSQPLCIGRSLEEDVDCSEGRTRVLAELRLDAGSPPPPLDIECL